MILLAGRAPTRLPFENARGKRLTRRLLGSSHVRRPNSRKPPARRRDADLLSPLTLLQTLIDWLQTSRGRSRAGGTHSCHLSVWKYITLQYSCVSNDSAASVQHVMRSARDLFSLRGSDPASPRASLFPFSLVPTGPIRRPPGHVVSRSALSRIAGVAESCTLTISYASYCWRASRLHDDQGSLVSN